MLSAANPPDPPCPRKVLASSSDEKGHPSESPASSPEADPADGPADEAQYPHFSIRDYVFASRSKDIGTNWPFPQQYLQLCAKHGVRNLLPPFEPPDLVRTRLSGKCAEAGHLIVCSELEGTQTEVSDAVKHCFNLPTQESVLGSSHQPQNPLSEDKSTVVQAVGSEDELFHGESDQSKVTGNEHTRSLPSSVSQRRGSVQETRSTISESSSEVEVAKPPRLAEKFGGSSEPSIKKCRLIVKFGGAPEPNRTEDTVCNFSSVPDSMASKVCPVCKTFSSTSNTTLNAHIDQCLSAESNAKRDASNLSRHKVKPRKKRSMEDICATAPRCTLEDLDRRNGTSWALELTSMAQNNAALCTTESKQPRISSLKVYDDEREGAVYVDSNGTKVLILSRFNDARSAAAVDCSGQKECTKEFKNKDSPFGKKKCLPPKHRKYLKGKAQTKKMSSFGHLEGEIHKERKLHADTHHEGRISQPSNAPEQISVGKPGTLGHWICSKRSSLLKHLNSKSSHRKPRNPLAITHHTSMESDQSASCDYLVTGGCTQNICKSSDETLSPPKIRNTNALSDTILSSFSQGKHSANLPDKGTRSVGTNPSTSDGIMLKLSRSTGKCVSSAKGKRVEAHADAVQKSGKFRSLRKASMGCHPQAHKGKKGSRRSLLIDGSQCMVDSIKCNEVVQGVVSRRLQKRRFTEKPPKAAEKMAIDLAEGFHDSPSANILDSSSNNGISGMHQSNFSDKAVRPETSDTFDHASPCQDNTKDSSQADVYFHASEVGEYLTSNYSQLEADCHHAEVTKFDGQTVVPANMDSVVEYQSETAIAAWGCTVVMSEDHRATTCDRLDSCLSLEEQTEPSGSNEATIIASLPKLLDDQRMYHGVIASDVVHQDIWQVGQIVSNVKDGYCSELQNIEYQADAASIQGSSACLSRPEDEDLELGKNSLVTSARTVTAGTQKMFVDGEPSGSPVSATPISDLSVEDLKYKDAERELSEEPVVIQEKFRPDSRNLGLRVDDSIRGAERTDLEKITQKVKETTSAREPDKFWDGQPCCCSRKESIPPKSRIFRQSATAGMMLPTKTKQISSSLYIKPVISSPGTYSHSTSEVKAIPILDSPTDSISSKAYSDFGTRFPTFSNFRSASPSSHVQPQTSTNPVLRLMGKNLMVMTKEERPVQQQNQTAPHSSENALNGKYMSLLGLSSTCKFSNFDGIQYHPHRSLEVPTLARKHPSNIQAPFPLAAEQMGCVAGTSLQSVGMIKTDCHAHHRRSDKKPNSSPMYNPEKVCSPHERQTSLPVAQVPIPERDIIVIDDSPEHETEVSGSIQNSTSIMAPPFSVSADIRQVRPFSVYASQNLFQSRELGRGLKSRFPISCPRRNTNSTRWGSTSESSGPLLPGHFVVPSLSAGQLPTALYHSPSFQ